MDYSKHNNRARIKPIALGLVVVFLLLGASTPVNAVDTSEIRDKVRIIGTVNIGPDICPHTLGTSMTASLWPTQCIPPAPPSPCASSLRSCLPPPPCGNTDCTPPVCDNGGCLPPPCEGDDCTGGDLCETAGGCDVGHPCELGCPGISESVGDAAKTASIACVSGGGCVGAYGASCTVGIVKDDNCSPTVAWCTDKNSWHIEGEMATGPGRKLSIRFLISCAGVELGDCIVDEDMKACVSLEVEGDGEVGCYWTVEYGEPVDGEVSGRCIDPINPGISIPAQPLPKELEDQLGLSYG